MCGCFTVAAANAYAPQVLTTKETFRIVEHLVDAEPFGEYAGACV
jgi:hypothetical protein